MIFTSDRYFVFFLYMNSDFVLNYNLFQVENHSDPVGAIIDIYRQAGNISLTRLSLIQSLLAHGIITHAQYMSFMYMKSVLAQCNGEGKGSVKAEVRFFLRMTSKPINIRCIRTDSSCYRQFPTNIRIQIMKLILILLDCAFGANNTGFNLMTFYFNIHGKLFIIRCDR